MVADCAAKIKSLPFPTVTAPLIPEATVPDIIPKINVVVAIPNTDRRVTLRNILVIAIAKIDAAVARDAVDRYLHLRHRRR